MKQEIKVLFQMVDLMMWGIERYWIALMRVGYPFPMQKTPIERKV